MTCRNKSYTHTHKLLKSSVTDLLSFALVSPLVLVVNSTEVGHNNRNWKRDDEDSTERTHPSHHLARDCVWHHVSITVHNRDAYRQCYWPIHTNTHTQQADDSMLMDDMMKNDVRCMVHSWESEAIIFQRQLLVPGGIFANLTPLFHRLKIDLSCLTP